MNIQSLINDRQNADGTIKVSRGPALLFANAGASVLHMRDDLTLKVNAEEKETVGTVSGRMGRQTSGDRPEMETKPLGYWGDLTFWFAMLGMAKGEHFFTEANKIVDVLGTTDLLLWRFWRGAVIGMSDLNQGNGEDLMETLRFGFVRRFGYARSAANALFQVYDLKTLTYTIGYGEGVTTAALAFNATAAAVQAALNATIIGTGQGNEGGVVVTGGHDKGGYVVTWNTAGARSTAFTGTLASWPSGAAFSQTVLTAGTESVREVRLIKITPYMTGYTAALTPIPKLLAKCSWISPDSTWKPTWGGSTAATAISGAATAAELQTSLRTLTSDNGLTVTGSLEDDWIVTMTAGAQTNSFGAAEITGMPPGTSLKAMVTTAGAQGVSQVVRLKLSPWASFASRAPVKISWNTKVEPVPSPLLGNDNYVLAEMPQPKIVVEPDAMLAADAVAAAALQGVASAELGAEQGDDAQPLNLINDRIYIRFWKAVLSRETLINWALNKERVGQLTFEALEKIESTGVKRPVATVGTSAPA